MPLISIYKCDECGRLKEDSNHWFVTNEYLNNSSEGDRRIIVGILEVFIKCKVQLDDSYRTLCGRECVQKVVERYMAEAVK